MVGTDRTGGDGAGGSALPAGAGRRGVRRRLTVGGGRVGVAVGGPGGPQVLGRGLLRAGGLGFARSPFGLFSAKPSFLLLRHLPRQPIGLQA